MGVFLISFSELIFFFFFWFSGLCNHIESFFSNRKCGQRPPSNPLEVTSSGNIMLINLITDSEVQRPGFSATYMAIPKSKGNPDERMKAWLDPPTRLYSCAAHLFFVLFFFSATKCGGVLTETKGVITSPLHPSFYPPAVDCKWTIKVCPIPPPCPFPPSEER